MAAEEGIYGRIAGAVLNRSKLLWVVVALVSVVAAVIGLPPKVDSDLLKLLPQQDPVVEALNRIQYEDGGIDLLSLSFVGDDQEKMGEVLDELTATFEGWDDVEYVMHGMPEQLEQQVGLLQFEADEISKLNARLEGALLLGPAARNGIVAQRILDMGPLTERIAEAQNSNLFGGRDGLDKIYIRPSVSSVDPAYTVPFMDRVYATLDEAGLEEQGIEMVWAGGPYRHGAEDVKGIGRDLAWTSLVSLGLVLTIIGVTFRSFKAVLIVFPPLIVANLLSLAFVRLTMGSLNTYTSFANAILLGLGIDFAIHLVGRYRELHSEGLGVEEAIRRAWSMVGPPSMTAALTSAAGFLALAAAQFKGFSQLGVVLAAGLLLSLGCMLVMLPPLIRRLDAAPVPLGGAMAAPVGGSSSSYRYSPLGLGAMLLLTVVVGFASAPKLQFEYDISNLRPAGNAYDELDEVQRELVEQSYAPVVVTYDNMQDLAEDQDRMAALVEKGELSHIAGVASIRNMLPDDQAVRNEQLRKLVELVESPNLRYLPPSVAQQLLPLRGLDIRELTRDDLPPIVKMLIGANIADRYRLVVIPQGNLWDVREATELADQLAAALPGREIAGQQLGIARMFHLVLDDLPVISGLALMMVVGLAWWDLRKLHWAAGAILTLLTGMTWAIASLPAVGLKLTMVNLTGFPILLGIGVDVVIHLLHRLKEEGPGGVRRALRTTGVAASISTLTTIGSFFAITLAANRGVASLGTLVVVGLTVVFLISAGLLPLLWSAGWKLSGQAPADQDRDEAAEG